MSRCAASCCIGRKSQAHCNAESKVRMACLYSYHAFMVPVSFKLKAPSGSGTGALQCLCNTQRHVHSCHLLHREPVRRQHHGHQRHVHCSAYPNLHSLGCALKMHQQHQQHAPACVAISMAILHQLLFWHFLHDGSYVLAIERCVMCFEIGANACVLTTDVTGIHIMVAGSLHLNCQLSPKSAPSTAHCCEACVQHGPQTYISV